ncbi:MAG: hypothetical protein NTV21_20560 [Planctomycetota bacterium]|nr:hypothetical protein [Planctomycetota bacterium]
MKKTLAIAAVLLLALTAWFGWRRIASANPDPSGPVSLQETTQVEPPPPAAPLPAEVLAQREEIAQEQGRESEAPAVGRAEITLRWSDGTPAVGVGATMELSVPRGAPQLLERAVSDGDGRVTFASLAPGRNRLAIDAREEFWLKVPADRLLQQAVTLAAGENVRGKVIDTRGQPIADARIVFDSRNGWAPVIEVAGSTDASGEFFLRDVNPDVELGARAVGFVPSPLLRVQDLPARSGDRRIEFRLESGRGRLVGRVLAPDGTPFAGASIVAGPRNGHIVPSPLGGNATAPQRRATTSGADGRFEIGDSLPSGIQPVHCLARGFAAWTGETKIGEITEEIVIQLEPAARIEGRVVDADGTPVAGAEVVQSVEHLGGWFLSDAFPPARDTTDAQGWFVLEWIGTGPRELNAWHDEHRELGRARAIVECRAGETTRCELRLDRGATISGRVVDDQGQALANWYVGSQPSDWMDQWYPRSMHTDAEGRFLLVNLGPGNHDLSVRTPNLSAARLELKSVAPGTRDLELVIPGAHTSESALTGRIVATSVDLLAGLELTLWRVGQNEGRFLEYDANSGQFRGQALPGQYRLEITRNGANVAAVPSFEVRENESADLGDIALGERGPVELELVGLEAAELARVRVRLVREGLREVWLSNENGRAFAAEVLSGRWELRTMDAELELSPSVLEVQPGAPTRVQVEVRPKRR